MIRVWLTALFPAYCCLALSSPIEIGFDRMKVVRHYAPYLSLEEIGSNPAEIEARLQDLIKRKEKRCCVDREAWEPDAGLPEGATVTVIRDLVENAGLAFETVAPATGVFRVGIKTPTGPAFGEFEVRLGNRSLGIRDPWSPSPTPSSAYLFPGTVEIQTATLDLRIFQKSPADAPIFLKSIQLHVPGKNNPDRITR